MCLRKTGDTLVVFRVLGDLEGWQAANESSRINRDIDACEGLWVLLTTESHGGQKSSRVTPGHLGGQRTANRNVSRLHGWGFWFLQWQQCGTP